MFSLKHVDAPPECRSERASPPGAGKENRALLLMMDERISA